MAESLEIQSSDGVNFIAPNSRLQMDQIAGESQLEVAPTSPAAGSVSSVCSSVAVLE